MINAAALFRRLAAAAAVCVATLLATGHALADKLHLKDGRVLEGTVVREGDGFLFFKVKVGGVEQQMLFNRDEIVKVERDDATPKTDENLAKAEESKKADAKKSEKTHTGATRVAILNFGGPSDWQGKYEDMVGVQVSADAFRKAIPLLEKAKTDIVVVRINSGGGYGREADLFREVFEKEFKPKFRTVAWIESAISAAAMGPWVLEEFYFLQKGNIGACTGWYGRLVAVKGIELEEMLYKMEKASDLGKKDRRIMRAMQIMDPLSVDVDENGDVHWRQDEDGQYVLNHKGKVYTMNANDAMRFKVGRGIANTKEELAKAMGLQEVEWVAQDATDLVDKSIRDNDAVDKHNKDVLQKYRLAVGVAQQLQDKERRGAQIAVARRHLADLRRMVAVNPNFEWHLGIPREWFEAQEELLKELGARP